jgi:plastocyanin
VFRSIALLSFALVAAPAVAADGGVVEGTVVTGSPRWREGVVVSLSRPGLEAPPPGPTAEMDQHGMRFVPHVLPIVAGTTVRFLNSDPEPHNVYSPEGRYNLGTWPTGETREHRFDRPGAYTQLCRVHPDMEAFVVVLDTPHFAVTDESGAFEIRGVPPGSYELRTWSERLDPVRIDVSVSQGETRTVTVELP